MDGGSGSSIDDTVVVCFASQIFCRSHAYQCAVKLVQQHVNSLYKWMDSSGEWRRIGKIHVLEIFQSGIHGNSHNSNVDHFVYGTRAEYLCTEKLVGVFICDQLGDEESRIRIVVRFVVCDRKSGDHLISGLCSLLLCKTGASAV